LLGLRDPPPNYTQIQIRFGATSWGKIQTEHPSLLTRIAATKSVSLCVRMNCWLRFWHWRRRSALAAE